VWIRYAGRVGTAGDVGRDFGGTFGPRRWLVGLGCADPQFTRRITVIDTNFAGDLTSGSWRFRYVAADVPTAACRSAANQNAVAGIALKSNIFGDVAHIDLRCGGGHGSVMFGTAAEPKATSNCRRAWVTCRGPASSAMWRLPGSV
jgi:hypothetical protein